MDGYIARLKTFLGPGHPSTQGFTIIRDLLERGEAPKVGIFYAGKNRTKHDLIVYSIGKEQIEFSPIPGDNNLLTCLENATEVAAKIRNPPRQTDNLIILPLDEAAVKELHALQGRLNGSGCTINGHNIQYVSVPLIEQITPYEKASCAVEDVYAAAAEDHAPLSTQAEALRQGILARYEAEKAIKTKSRTNIKPRYADPSAIHISAP